jgi:hypothetical protein
LPPALAEKLPAGYVQISAWELGGGFWGVSGDLDISARYDQAKAGGAKAEFFYMTSAGWRKTEAGDAVCADGTCTLALRAPLSAHYALAVKK